VLAGQVSLLKILALAGLRCDVVCATALVVVDIGGNAPSIHEGLMEEVKRLRPGPEQTIFKVASGDNRRRRRAAVRRRCARRLALLVIALFFFLGGRGLDDTFLNQYANDDKHDEGEKDCTAEIPARRAYFIRKEKIAEQEVYNDK